LLSRSALADGAPQMMSVSAVNTTATTKNRPMK
jgi:hypothetical protein